MNGNPERGRLRRPDWWLDPAEVATLLYAHMGRTWPSPATVADWLAQAETNRWDIRPWPAFR